MPDRALELPVGSQRGSLFLIGGREIPRQDPTLLEQFVRRCGGTSARFLVLSTASPDPERKRIQYGKVFASLGVRRVSILHQDRREQAEDPALQSALDRADGVFFTGGNQLKLVTTLAGTSLAARLRERHGAGLHVAGTSAGASALSAVMIARGRARTAPRLACVRLSPGLGLLPQVIVDQHFRERDRFGRLLTAVLCNPSLLGFGVDENTAFRLEPDDRAHVLGEGTLTVVDGSELQGTNLDELEEDEPAAFAGMRLHVLREGWSYDLARRRVGMPPPERKAERPDAPRPLRAEGERR